MYVTKLLKNIKRIIFNDFYSLILYRLKYKYFIPRVVEKKNYKFGVTAVITSCGRPRKLESMLYSLIKFSDLKFDSIIFVEDSGCIDSIKIAKKYFPKTKLKIIYHKKNVGQLISIDEAYKLVKTKYIFHLEEDWEFIKTGFLKYSLDIFKNNPRLAALSIRPHKDWSSYSFFKENGFYIFDKTHNFIWNGICINPGLYDKSKYDLLGDYQRYKKERIIAQIYRGLGFQGGLALREKGYVIHTGDGYSTRKKFNVA